MAARIIGAVIMLIGVVAWWYAAKRMNKTS